MVSGSHMRVMGSDFHFRTVNLAALCRMEKRRQERGLLFVAVRGLLIAVASLVAEHGL